MTNSNTNAAADQSQDIKVTFTNPRSGKTFPVELSLDVTGDEAIGGLIGEEFLAKPDRDGLYTLQHAKTGKSLPLNQSLGHSGVRDGDVIAVIAENEGHMIR